RVLTSGTAPTFGHGAFAFDVTAPQLPGRLIVTVNCVPRSDCSNNVVQFILLVDGSNTVAKQEVVEGALRSFGTLARSGLDATSVQLTNLQNRMRDRRNGSGGLSLYGASLDDGKNTLPGSALQSLVASYLGGDNNSSAQQLL